MSDHDAKTLDTVLSLLKELAPNAEGEVLVRTRREANTRFAVGSLTTNGDFRETQTRVEVAEGNKHAATTTNQTDPAALRTAVLKALELMRLSPPDPEWMGVLGPQDIKPSPAHYDAATAELQADTRGNAAAACIAAADAAGLVSAGFYAHRSERLLLGTTAGLRASHARTHASLSTTARAKDGSGSGWAGAESQRAADLDAAALGRVAAEKGRLSQKPKPLAPGRYTVVLEPAAVADMVGFLAGALRARAADEGRSFFAKAGGGTRLGETIWPASITLTSDPWDPLTPGTPFDEDGLPLEPMTWIDKGTLKALAYDRFWAKKQGKKATSSPVNVHLHGGDAPNVDALVAGTKRGLLVTRFFYTRWVDPRSMVITGLTRDGVLLIEDGRIVGPVQNFRFNESPAVMLKNVEAMTKETYRVPLDGFARARVPAVRTAEFTMASVSEAI
jgi:predicted Zn-dependent protease